MKDSNKGRGCCSASGLGAEDKSRGTRRAVTVFGGSCDSIVVNVRSEPVTGVSGCASIMLCLRASMSKTVNKGGVPSLRGPRGPNPSRRSGCAACFKVLSFRSL